MERLAPKDFATAVSSSHERAQRKSYGLERAGQRRERTLKNTDLHKLFRAGRELVFVKADGTVSTSKLTAGQAKNAIVLVEKVKAIAGLEPQVMLKDERLARELGGKQAGWSISTVRRTRRVCAAAGIEVAPLRSDGTTLAQPELQGSLWVLDRRRLLQLVPPPPPESQMNRGVVTGDHPLSIGARENGLPLEDPDENVAADAERGPPPSGGDEQIEPGDVRAPKRRRWRARPPSEPAPGDCAAELTLLRRLLDRRWKVGQDWGLAAALAAAESLALAEGAHPDRVAVARRVLAFQLMGEQLSLESDGPAP